MLENFDSTFNVFNNFRINTSTFSTKIYFLKIGEAVWEADFLSRDLEV